MKTLDLSHEQITVEGLLQLAAEESVRIVSPSGQVFVLEEGDDFDREVELLGSSEAFQRFLDERSKEPGRTSLEDYRRSLQ